MECIGAIDQGTQSSRFYIFDAQAQPVASAQVALQQHCPQAGWCEHDPVQILDSVRTCIARAVQIAEEKVGPVRIAALGITNQRETTVVWDRTTGKPLHNAIVWLDNRTSDICHRMRAELGGQDYFRPVTGLPISTYFSAFKYLWLYENVPQVRAAVEEGRCMVGTVDSWLIYQLTGGADGGVHVTDGGQRAQQAAPPGSCQAAARRLRGSWFDTTAVRAAAAAAVLAARQPSSPARTGARPRPLPAGRQL
jgi:glycerol kinase